MSLIRGLTRGLTRGLGRNLDRSVGASIVQPDIDDFTLGTGAIDPGTVVAGLHDFWISSNGEKLYLADLSNQIQQMTMTTPFLISSAGSRVAGALGSFSWAGVQVSADGSKIYGWRGFASNEFLYSGDCDTAFDITALSNISNHVGTTSNPTVGEGVYVLEPGDGDAGVYYVIDATGQKISKWTMGTPGTASTGSLTTAVSLDFSGEIAAGNADGFDFSPNGTKVYVLDGANDVVYQYNLTSAWDMNTGSYSGKSLALTSRDTPTGIQIRKDTGTTMWIMYGGSGVGLFDEYVIV